MRHFSCDMCSKDLVPGSDTRCTIRLEARVVCDPPELTDADLMGQDDPDHIDAMEKLLAANHDTVDEQTETGLPTWPLVREYDLCIACYNRFQSDPLGLDRTSKLHFSSN